MTKEIFVRAEDLKPGMMAMVPGDARGYQKVESASLSASKISVIFPGGYERWKERDFEFSVMSDSVDSPIDNVNHPTHYTSHPSGIECIQVTEHMNFNIGNAVKYLWRSDDKGDPIENLKKAAWYVTREIERREKGATK